MTDDEAVESVTMQTIFVVIRRQLVFFAIQGEECVADSVGHAADNSAEVGRRPILRKTRALNECQCDHVWVTSAHGASWGWDGWDGRSTMVASDAVLFRLQAYREIADVVYCSTTTFHSSAVRKLSSWMDTMIVFKSKIATFFWPKAACCC